MHHLRASFGHIWDRGRFLAGGPSAKRDNKMNENFSHNLGFPTTGILNTLRLRGYVVRGSFGRCEIVGGM